MTKFPLLKLKYFIQIILILSITLFFTGCSSSLPIKRIEANPLELKLINSVKKGNLDELNTLLANKTVRMNAQDYYGKTALIYASGNNNTAIIKLLIKNKANLNQKDKPGSTAFLKALEKNLT